MKTSKKIGKTLNVPFESHIWNITLLSKIHNYLGVRGGLIGFQLDAMDFLRAQLTVLSSRVTEFSGLSELVRRLPGK